MCPEPQMFQCHVDEGTCRKLHLLLPQNFSENNLLSNNEENVFGLSVYTCFCEVFMLKVYF